MISLDFPGPGLANNTSPSCNNHRHRKMESAQPIAKTTKGRDVIGRKNRRKLYQFDEEIRDTAQRAAQIVAQHALELALEDPSSSTILPYDLQESPVNKNSSQWQNQKQVQQYPLPRSHVSSIDVFETDSHSSYFSQERAMFRGSNRAILEENEIVRRFQDDDRDLTTAAETRLSTISEKKNNKKKKPRKSSLLFGRDRFDKLPRLGVRINLTEISKEAWMCGVCAKSFSSFEAAQKHEDYHIKEVVMDLGWVCTTPRQQTYQDIIDVPNFFDQTTPRASVVRHDERNPDGLQVLNPGQQGSSSPSTPLPPPVEFNAFGTATFDRNFGSTIQPPRPDVLTVSKSSRTLSRRNVSMQQHQPPPTLGKKRLSLGISSRDPFASSASETRYFEPIDTYNDLTAEHDLLVPHGMRDYVVLADEALIDVCSKAAKLMLSQVEEEAEFELECYAKDKSYYDMLEQREILRQRDGAYSRFKTEGKNIAQKVQNKFVDAYALMKEGNSKSKRTASVDHYTRKQKGDSEFHNVINNTDKTLYVNVIVKNSIHVVSHELERLARQRWEEYKTNNEGLVDTRHDDGRAQFEKFKAAAQGNLVKLAGLALASDFTPRRIAVQLSNDLYRCVLVVIL